MNRKIFILIVVLAIFAPLFSFSQDKGAKSALLPNGGNQLYDNYFKKYTSKQEQKHLAIIWEQAEYFVPFIEAKVKEEGLPLEVIYLPFVESNFKPDAVSKSGATGLWQFMTNSIEGYNMKINEWVDERRDFWKATEAALKKIKYNYSVLKDWNLAIAAYNCGLGKMKRTVREGGTSDYWKLCQKGLLSKETIHYIPKLLAISDVLKNRSKYGIKDKQPKPFQWIRIALSQPVDIRLLAKETGIPRNILDIGNSELKFYVTPPAKTGYLLKVPADKAEKIKSVTANKKTKLTDFHLYTIKAGDTLSHLSQHYGISISMIQSFNNVDPNNLKIGSKLVIPVSDPDIKPYGGTFDLSSWVPDISEEGFAGEYTVQEGDTLWSIAKLFHTDIKHIAYFNHLELDSVLSIGKTLKVPTPPEEMDFF
ncbi:MAG: LysM peptidoglycan-binding domain-containing protein [Spirochaetia bacterium]|nr:LysM peptidoglycan-binding domain-containing protein [Spirochaetia bacterium]